MPRKKKQSKKEPDLKEQLSIKSKEFKELKETISRKAQRAKDRIKKEEKEILNKSNKELKKKLNKIEKRYKDSLKKLKRKERKLFSKAENMIFKARKSSAITEREAHRNAKRASKQVEEMSKKEINSARKELISIRKRAYSRRRKVINTLQFIGVIYLFILSIVLLKDVTLALSGSTVEAITGTVDNNVTALGAGWFTTVIAQSGSVIAILANSLVGSNVLSFEIGFYILVGVIVGNNLTPVLASLVLRTKHHWRLRHGFELGLAGVIYSIYLVILALLIQIPTGIFTRWGDAIAAWADSLPAFVKIPDLLDVITGPLIHLVKFDTWPVAAGFVAAVFLLIFSLGRVGKSMFIFLGGKRHTRAIMEKYLSSHWKSFGIGLLLTIIVPSASLLNTLMVPLAIARVVTLRQAIPYIIGTSVGTFIDVLMASLANADGYAIAGGIVLTIMSSLGVFFIFGNFGCTLIHKSTRYLSTHVIKMRRRNILKYIAGFAAIPAIIMFIF